MAQHDYVIANGTGAAVRSDLNNALAAIVSQNSGATEPATTYAFQFWVDTTTNIVKMRNGANSAWIELFETDGEFGSKTFNGNITLNAQGDLRFADSDSSNWVAFQAPATVASNVTWTLPSADGTANQTLITNGSGTLSWATPSATVDKITEGNTEAEVVDTGSNGHFKVTTEGTERFRCDSSGRLLLGTSSASTATDSQYSRLQIVGHTGGTEVPGRMILRRNETSANISISESIGEIYFGDNQAGEYALIKCEADNTAGSNDYPGRLVFSTTADGASSPTERMRIDNNGRLLVGTTTIPISTTTSLFTDTRAFVNGDGFTDQCAAVMANGSASGSNNSGASTCYLARYSTAAATTPGALFKGYQDTTIVIKINNNGNVTNSNNSYGSLSDAKLKENVVDAGSQWNDIKALQVRNYNFKKETGQQTHRQIGLIAQEVEPISPGLVVDFPDANNEVTKAINYSVLYMKAVKALQEAMERIEQLEAKVAALESA